MLNKGSVKNLVLLAMVAGFVAYLFVFLDTNKVKAWWYKSLVKIVSVGECKPTFTIDDNKSKVTESELAATNCYEKLNRDDCLEVDVYDIDTNSFSRTDGIVDCEWVN